MNCFGVFGRNLNEFLEELSENFSDCNPGEALVVIPCKKNFERVPGELSGGSLEELL